ncbi:YlxR family protein [bacterium]|nr:YlxR family protein [bacterium]
MEHKRKCAGCGALKEQNGLIKITYNKQKNEVFINPNTKIFGRSVYLCYNKMCIENALKKNKIQKSLKANISEELKGKLIEYG